MPYYHFRCKDHGMFEVFTSMGKAGAERPCPKCGENSKRAWKTDRAVVVWKGPGNTPYYANRNIGEVEEQIFESITETEE